MPTDPAIPPLVSVGLPVFNGADRVGGAIESLLDQSFADFELVISDNHSEDETWEVCRQYADGDPRIRCVRQTTNIGANGNFNALFRMAKGRYFKWAGHDDRWDPKFLETCVRRLEENPQAVLAYCGEQYVDDQHGVERVCNDVYDISSGEPDSRYNQWMWAMEDPNDGRSDLVYGVIRSDALHKTRLFTNTLFTNQLLVLELVTLGTVEYVPEVMVTRSPAPHRTIDQRIRRMDPTAAARRLSFPHWGLLKEFLSVAASLDLSLDRRLAMMSKCLRFFSTGRQGRRMLWDVRRSGRALFGRRSHQLSSRPIRTR
jgi:hypothetical protein